jgi:hypothetical protein
MGWENAHLHEFKIGGLRFTQKMDDGFLDMDVPAQDETVPLVSQLVPQSGKQAFWSYLYDFGDSWRHDIVFEGCGTLEPRVKYPRCTDGALACPQEDCGGPWGYAELIESLADPDHERHEELLDWCGPIDPEDFNVKRATSAMRKWLREVRE